MSHYTREEWRMYRQDLLKPERRRRMEQHLAGCELCLEAYLSATDSREQELAELLLPDDFTSRTALLIEKKMREAQKKERKRILAQYIAAASITLALMAGGVFDFAAREIPLVMQETTSISRSIHEKAAADWPEQLLFRINRLFSSEEDD